VKRRDVSKYYHDIDEENNGEDSPYDFTAVDLRGENHANESFYDLDGLSFDDDSYGDLPFDDDLELVEEDFSFRKVLDDLEDDEPESVPDEDYYELDDEKFVLEKPADAPDFTEEFLEDDEPEQDIAPKKLFSKRNKEEDLPVIPATPVVSTVKTGTVAGATASTSASKRIVPKVRNSALQPLLVINRSKHSFDQNKKTVSENMQVTDFDDFDEVSSIGFDDGDIEDMSHSIDSEEIPEEDITTDDFDTETFAAEDIENVSAEEIVDQEASVEDAEGEDISVADTFDAETVIPPDISDDTEPEISIGTETETEESAENHEDSTEEVSLEEASEEPADESISEEIPKKNGRIFFDDFEDDDDVFKDDDKPIFEPHTVQAIDVTKRAADALESAEEDYHEDDVVESDTDENDSAEDSVTEDIDVPEETSAKKSIDTRIKELKMARKKKKRQKKVKNFVKEIFGWVGLVFAAFFIAIVINLYVARPSVVSGRSMMPTLTNGDTIIISKVPYMLGEVEYGDIVVIDRQVERERTFTVEVVESLKYNVLTQSLFDENELNEDIFWVKRIIGLPGDVIEFYEGKVYRNGELLDEGYIFTQDVESYPNGEQFVVQEGCVFVMGDNRNESLDSRSLAMHDEQIAMDHIVGKLISK